SIAGKALGQGPASQVHFTIYPSKSCGLQAPLSEKARCPKILFRRPVQSIFGDPPALNAHSFDNRRLSHPESGRTRYSRVEPRHVFLSEDGAHSVYNGQMVFDGFWPDRSARSQKL